MANLGSFDNDTVEVGGGVDYKLAGCVHTKVEPEEMLNVFWLVVVDYDQPDQSLVDQVGWGEAEQELCCVGCLLLLLLVVQLLLLLLLGDLLLGVLGDALEWVAQVEGEK